jgi:retrograde regulation protein 2
LNSNGIRFSITSLAPPRSRLLDSIYSERAGISLFDALTPSESGDLIFPPATIASVSSAVARFIRLADLHDVARSNIMIYATEAMRRAANAAQMLSAIAEATQGIHVSILEPAVETLFGAIMGTRSSLSKIHDGALFLDLGGGSVQITWVDTSMDGYETKAARAGNSMPFGAAKLSRILDHDDDEFRETETRKLGASMLAAYDNLCYVFPKLGAIRSAYQRGEDARVDVYMCGGGFRGYGSLLMHNDEIKPYPIPSIGTYTVDATSFTKVDELRAINESYEGKIAGMSRRRRQQFTAISTVVEAFITAVPNIGRVTFCKGSNKEGALMMKLPLSIRESNPLNVLANVRDDERSFFASILQKLAEAVPNDVRIEQIPSVLQDGVGFLFVQEIWKRCGFDSDTNASFALHNAVIRDPDTPGLTHLTRAVLGLTQFARWDSAQSPADEDLANGLRGILRKHHADAVFWSHYLGTIASVLFTVFPVRPKAISALRDNIKYVLQSQDLKTHY